MNEISKTQGIRIIDITFIGPFMIYYALMEDHKQSERIILGGLGLATILYNMNNYYKQRKFLIK